MVRMHGRTAAAIVALTIACMTGGACRRSHNTLSPTGPTPAVNINKVAIEGQVNLSVGQTIQLMAFVTNADGSKEDVTGQALWSADAPDIASVDRGLVRGLKAGGVRIMATYQSITGVFSVTIVGAPGTPQPPVAGPGPDDPGDGELPSPAPSPTPPAPPPAPTPPGPAPSPTPAPAPSPPAPAPPGPTPPAPAPSPTPPAPAPPAPGPTVTSLTVTGSTSLSPGASTQLTAMATMSDGTRVDVTGQATWSSSHPLIASVSAQGQVSGLGAGLCGITATFKGVTARVEIQVTGTPVIESLTITGVTQLRVGQSIQLRVVARFSDGSQKDVTDLAEWTCSNSLLGHVSEGLLRGLGPGSINVAARYLGKSALATVQITL